ncbi:hypothetical protein C4S77_02405 [Apibacter adventoris]|uniref:Uncharacterized protein n=2 Tax=Apibacter adventoris TaxID=1679466 RepID=A0A2S8AFD5_9FLAO|nr:hypothetical protein C4S77_02405 [Apibacter adventoris]
MGIGVRIKGEKFMKEIKLKPKGGKRMKNKHRLRKSTKGSHLKFKSIFKKYKDIINAYIMTTDPLNQVQDNPRYLLPSVEGTRYNVTPVSNIDIRQPYSEFDLHKRGEINKIRVTPKE